MNREHEPWKQLVALAREAAAGDDAPPLGFATRVVARAGTLPPSAGLLETFAFRGFLAAATCCAGALAFSYLSRPVELADDPVSEDTVSTLLELS